MGAEGDHVLCPREDTMKTPEEAAKCWCPQATPETSDDYQLSGNRRDDGSFKSQLGCLGPQCMWWEWETAEEPKKGFCGVKFYVGR